jgi:hypothetical protein
MILEAGAMALFTPIHLRDASGAVIKGTNVWKSGAIFGRAGQGFRHGLQNTVRGQIPFMLVSAGLSGAMAPRHHALSAMSRTLGGAIGGMLGFTFGGAVGGMAGDKVFGAGLEKTVQAIADIGSERGKLHMGGNFVDSQAAWTMRQTAVQSMATSNLNARRYLGQEAAFMHT